MSRPIPILYEDDWGDVKEFGLHELLVSAIADTKGSNWWDLKGRYKANPKRGDAKLLAACRDEVPLMPHPQMFAIFDGDKLHKLLFRSGKPEPEVLLEALRKECPDPRLHLFLLLKNTETVVDAAADCLGLPRPAKDPLKRDRLLLKVARGLADGRDCVRRNVPSFDECVKAIASAT